MTGHKDSSLIQHLEVMNSERPPLGPQLFLGPEFPVMIGNYMKGLEEDRVRVIQAVFRKLAAA